MKAVLVAGTRPNFIKIAPLLKAIGSYPEIRPILLHTGQHYDYEMSNAFFQQLHIRKPDIFLGVGSGPHAKQTAEIMTRLESVLMELRPELVILVGDVNSTLAGALAAVKVRYSRGKRPQIAHVEAGLRSFDRSMPEEINRLITDSISDYLFTTCEDANVNLLREGHDEGEIHLVGNVMIDTLLEHIESAKLPPHLQKHASQYALLTLHRPSNVDNTDLLKKVINAVASVAEEIPVIFPAHPRTQKSLGSSGLDRRLTAMDIKSPLRKGLVYVLDPLPYLEFIALMKNSRMVLTDSGGIQEETTVLGIPCLTLRENTERPITIRIGTNVLVGSDPRKILFESRNILVGKPRPHQIPKYWDGHASERISAILAQRI